MSESQEWQSRFVQTFLLKSHKQSLMPSSHCFSDSLREHGNAKRFLQWILALLDLEAQLDSLGALFMLALVASFASVRPFKFLRNSSA
jgi:hypothetical protein